MTWKPKKSKDRNLPIVSPTLEEVSNWIYRINKAIKKEKYPERKRKQKIIKEELLELKRILSL